MKKEQEQEQLRVALKKAHEIKTKLDEFILHLNQIYRESFERSSSIFDRDTEQTCVGPEECSLMSAATVDLEEE